MPNAARTPRRMGYLAQRMSELVRPESRAAGEPLGRWAEKRIRLDGKPFSFAGHAYLRDIYNDTAPHVVIIKASQVGGSVYAILRAIHACLSRLNVIYFFPTRTDVIEFSKARVAPLIEGNPFLAKMVRETDTAGLKRIGEASLHLRGMQSSVSMKSVPGDMLIFDELDEASPDAKVLALERLAHSDYKRLIELSNPSLPGYGIDEAYQESDGRQWTLRCDACRHWFSPVREFPRKLGEEIAFIQPRGDGTYHLACPRCSAEVDPENGEWVAEYPDHPTHGYLISQLFSTRVDPGEILREYRKTRFPERFYNLKVGIAWADLENRVDEATVLRLCGEEGMPESSETPCTMGVDTGRDFHVVISQRIPNTRRRRIVHLAVASGFETLDELMRRFKVALCVIDALPELHATRAFAFRHPGRVFMNYFNEHQKGAAKWDYAQKIVQENRTEALDISRRALREGRVVLPRRSPIVAEFARHCAADAKQLHEDEETGSQSYRYVKTGTNHFSFAFTYDCIAAQREPRPEDQAVTRLSLWGSPTRWFRIG